MKRRAPGCRRCSPTRRSGPTPRAPGRRCRQPERTDSWQLLLDLVPLRLAAASRSGRARPHPGGRRDLRRARARAIRSARSRGCARRCRSRARAPALEREVLRLAEATGDFAGAGRARSARRIAAGGAPPLHARAPARAARRSCSRRTSAISRGARESYAAALALTPERLEPRRSLLRTLVRLGGSPTPPRLLVDANDVARRARHRAAAALRVAGARGRRDPRRARPRWTDAVDAAPRSTRPPAAICTRASPRRPSSSTARTRRRPSAALDAGARGAIPRHVPTLLRRAELQRRRPDRRLVDTLTRLAAEQPDNLDFLREAAGDRAGAARRRARWRSSCSAGSTTRAGNLLARDARAERPAGRRRRRRATPSTRAVRMHVAVGDARRGRRATTLLLDGARLRVRRRAALGLAAARRRADRRARSTTGGRDPDLAAAARAGARRTRSRARRWRASTRPRAASPTASPCGSPSWSARRDQRTPAGAAPRDRPPGRAARAAEQRARRPARQPGANGRGTPRRCGKLADVLVGKGRQAELADISRTRRGSWRTDGEPRPAAALWADAARLVEGALADAGRAMTAWQNARPSWTPKTEALDALGRLALAAGEPAAAAEWLDRRLAMTEGDARNEVAARAGGRARGGRTAPPGDRVPRARAGRIPARRSPARRCWRTSTARRRPGSRWRACWPTAASTATTRR